jgi:signal transduction histidine kinase
MNEGLAIGALIWAMVYTGLSVFMLLASRLFPGRGYALLAAAVAMLTVSALSIWLIADHGSGWQVYLGTRLIVLALVFAPLFHAHFLTHYCDCQKPRAFVWPAYIGAVVLVFLEYLLASRQSPLFGGEFQPEPLVELAVPLTVWVGVLLFVAIGLLAQALRQRRKSSFLPLMCLTFMGPVGLYDLTEFVVAGESTLLTETVLWLYALSIVLGLLWELRGAEGKLLETTSSLAERTLQLEVSYAELELVQSELFKKEQLALVGELAASIAHEVRNPLAIIMNAASGMRRAAVSDGDRDTLLSIVDEEARRLNQLVEELLRFARPIEAARVPASLYDICEQLRVACKEGYDVVLEASERVGAVLVDAGLFRLALDNLMANALQAMPQGGRVVLSISSGSFADGEPAAIVAVTDHGVGMAPGELERAKKPFFTTKPRGTGLGLSIAERIVEAHGGELGIESRVGVGTTVRLRLPVERISELPVSSAKGPHSRRRSLSSSMLGVGELNESRDSDQESS